MTLTITNNSRGKWMAAAALGLVGLLLAVFWSEVRTGFHRTTDASVISVPVWLLYIMAAIAVMTLGAIAVVFFRILQKRKTEIAPVTTAEVLGIRWRWTYQDGEMREVTSHCPKCDRQVNPTSEKRHGFLHLISYQCECRKWRSKSFQCSQVDMVERICRTVREQARK